VAIAKAIEAAIGKRQGQRTDKGLVENFPQVAPGTKTRDVAAEKAGFGNPKTYQQARRVVEKGVAELVEAMDAATTRGLPCTGMCGSWRCEPLSGCHAAIVQPRERNTVVQGVTVLWRCI
jgi:ParB family chromosome partitioning protein